MFDRSGELPSKAEYEYVSGSGNSGQLHAARQQGSSNVSSSVSGSGSEDNDTTETRSKTNEEPDAARKTKSLLQQTNRRHVCLSLRLSVRLPHCPSVRRSVIVLSEQCSAEWSRAEQS